MKIGTSKVDFKGLQIDGPSGSHTMEVKIMKLLRVLTDNAGEVMTREELITQVWGIEHGGDESLSRGISLLRKALGDKRGNHTHIVTIPRVGYRLIADVDKDVEAPTLTKPEKPSVSLPIFKLETQNHKPTIAPSRGSSLRTVIVSLAVIVSSLMIVSFVTAGLRNTEAVSIQAQVEDGLSGVQNYLKKGEIKRAQTTFRNILEKDPSHAAARAGLALALFREYTHLERDPALLRQAIGHAEASYRSSEHLALANIAVAWGAEFDGEFDRSLEYLDRTDILEPDNVFSIEGRYRLLGKQGQFDRAIELIDHAITLYPDHALFYSYRGNLFSRMGDQLNAEREFRRAVELSPDWARLYAALAHILHSQNRTTEAITIIQDGLKVDESALLYNNLGTYLFFKGQYDLSVLAFEKTIELEGDSHDYLYWANLGDAYRWSENKKDEASTHYKRALQLLQDDIDRNPTDVNLKSRAALFNAKLGNLEEAQSNMGAFTLTDTSPAIQHYRAVVTYEILADREAALDHLGLAMALDYPMNEILHDPELAQLRQDPAYHRLLAQTQSE